MSRAGKSEAQANAEALDRRGRTYADPNAASFRFAWDAGKRQPRDLSHAINLVRRAYADEVPRRLHNRDLADDGTPKMTPQTEGYIFGGDSWTDAGQGEAPLVSYYLTPFRATLADMERAREEATRKRAAIVRHVSIGGQGGQEAAIAEGVPSWCAKDIAFAALASFLSRLSDVRVDVPREASVA